MSCGCVPAGTAKTPTEKRRELRAHPSCVSARRWLLPFARNAQGESFAGIAKNSQDPSSTRLRIGIRKRAEVEL